MKETWNRFHSPYLSFVIWVVVLGSALFVASALVENEDEDVETCESPRFHPQDETLMLHPFNSISSTQDEAKRIAEEGWGEIETPPRSFLVTTREQTKGRGTNGRMWVGQRGNMFCTIGIRQQDWINTKIPLTLLPLKIGSLVAQHVQRVLDDCHPKSGSQDAPLVTVKWPNDVLVNERKISGILIESSSNGWFLIGIGINLVYAPEVEQMGPNRGRPATSVSDLCFDGSSISFDEKQAEQLGLDLAYDLHSFLFRDGVDRGKQVLNDWKQWIDWDMELVMRDTPGQERVNLVGVLPDGRVQVQHIDDGRIQTLVSDYFL